ncbi:hypothetical protein HMPREF9440_00574 [Sutterella parvirubra YIT 11816]|uniref:Uncharacterized protein n=1 Tax=Sutterella parvirubra YIT 11816 TaxID=762967 RepID=H3KCW9_9BURK|nr:hypothetical protein HMPREF9440_00574 [Sutterella parvirubra YIT 11816]
MKFLHDGGFLKDAGKSAGIGFRAGLGKTRIRTEWVRDLPNEKRRASRRRTRRSSSTQKSF